MIFFYFRKEKVEAIREGVCRKLVPLPFLPSSSLDTHVPVYNLYS
jgi:hypothetical protein